MADKQRRFKDYQKAPKGWDGIHCPGCGERLNFGWCPTKDCAVAGVFEDHVRIDTAVHDTNETGATNALREQP